MGEKRGACAHAPAGPVAAAARAAVRGVCAVGRPYRARPACPIHAALGLWCPLCGASRMGLALLRLDLPGALRANAVLLALLLPGTIWGAVHAVRYVRTGDGSVRRWERALLWGAVGVLLAGGVLRNLPAFAFLAPH